MKEEELEKVNNFILLAHDLKTNLTASKWLLGMIENGDFGTISEKQKEVFEKVKQANERMLFSINEALFMFRSGIIEQVYHFTPCDIDLVITKTLMHLQGELKEKNISISYTPPNPTIITESDVEKMYIVFQNIIENAIKYGNKNSIITIDLSKKGEEATCTITNEGIGIPETEKEHIFEKYFRASNSQSYESGTGIGLFGARQIIEKHGGSLTFVSKENEYTTFNITLPVKQKNK